MEKVIQNLCRSLDRRRFNVMVCCLDKKGDYADELEKEGFKVHLCPKTRIGGEYTRALGVGSLLRRERIDVLHSHNTAAFLDGFVGARIAGTPVFVHTDHVRKFPDKQRYMVAERIASYFVDQIVAVSERVKEDLVRYEGISPGKISIIYNGTAFSPPDDPGVDASVREELGIGAEEQVVGCIARLRKQKGYELFLAAAARVLEQMPNVKFLIVGDGEEHKRLVSLAAQLGIGSNVRFAGARTDIERLISVFSVFLLTSHYEGMPICLLESLASGVPVVSTAVGGVPEVIEDGVSGFLVDSREAGKIAEKVVELLRNRDLRERMGREGRRAYESRFTVREMADQYEELYSRYLNAKVLS